MLNMRRVGRRTSPSQAEPSPWRHCWTSWASCCKLPQPHLPDTCLGSTRRWVFRPANVWNAKCTGNVPPWGRPNRPFGWHLTRSRPDLQRLRVTTCWNHVAYPCLTPPLAPRTLLPHGIEVEESAVCRSGHPGGRIPALSFSRESPSEPVQRRQALGSRPPGEYALPPALYQYNLWMLRAACPPLAEISGPSRSREFLEHLPHDPRWLQRPLSPRPRRRTRAPTTDRAQRQNPALGHLRHLRARTHPRRRQYRGSRCCRPPHL